jgi:predicted  nucleic acid-binding Zn-ribbon protein
MTDRPDEASKLARLLRDIEDLERTRSALLERVEKIRSGLIAAGNRTAAIRASVDLLCDHLTDVATAAAEVSMLEQEIQTAERGLDQAKKDASGSEFESDSLCDTLDEADDELERLSSILVDRRVKHPKGH